MKNVPLFKGIIISLGVSLSLVSLTPVIAQTPFQNPLQVEKFDDPLLPDPPVIRPLSPLEKFRLEEALNKLNEQAKQVYQQGKVEEAFTIWYRELRLRQKLDRGEEIKALGRVGEIAWSENRSQDFRNIRERLREIETEAKANNQQNWLEAIAKSYERMRELDGAIALYQVLLETSANPNKILEKIAQLHQSQFHYQKAANTYEKLLQKTENDSLAQIQYLKKLSQLYEEAENYNKGSEVKQRLIALYQQQDNSQPLPNLMVSLGKNYEQMEAFDRASEIYQEAFQLAWLQQKYSIASEALLNLGQLYQNDGNLETTLDIYEQLLIVQERSYDHYGLMMTYDKMGAIYRQRGEQQQALIAYEKALKLARSLGYQENYFQNQVNQIKS